MTKTAALRVCYRTTTDIETKEVLFDCNKDVDVMDVARKILPANSVMLSCSVIDIEEYESNKLKLLFNQYKAIETQTSGLASIVQNPGIDPTDEMLKEHFDRTIDTMNCLLAAHNEMSCFYRDKRQT